MQKEEILKSYFVVHYILSRFQEDGGSCSMLAEEELFEMLMEYYSKILTEEYILNHLEMVFGFNKFILDESEKEHAKWLKEKKDLGF